MQIKLICTDFDGTLVDTQKANFLAYQKVLSEYNHELTSEMYDSLFGLRLNEFLEQIGITGPSVVEEIKQKKKDVYPHYFKHIRLNKILLDVITKFKFSGCKTALVSTAQRHNILNILNFFEITNRFDCIVSGNDIANAKPDPSAYRYAMKMLNCKPEETLIFEDSKTGIEAAQNAGSPYIIINNAFFEN